MDNAIPVFWLPSDVQLMARDIHRKRLDVAGEAEALLLFARETGASVEAMARDLVIDERGAAWLKRMCQHDHRACTGIDKMQQFRDKVAAALIAAGGADV